MTTCPTCHRKLQGQARDLTGQRFGKVEVLSYAGTDKHSCSVWNVRCDCGKEREVVGSYMTRGTTTSCGCQRGKRPVKE